MNHFLRVFLSLFSTVSTYSKIRLRLPSRRTVTANILRPESVLTCLISLILRYSTGFRIELRTLSRTNRNKYSRPPKLADVDVECKFLVPQVEELVVLVLVVHEVDSGTDIAASLELETQIAAGCP